MKYIVADFNMYDMSMRMFNCMCRFCCALKSFV